MPTLSFYGDMPITGSAAHARASIRDTAFELLYASERDAPASIGEDAVDVPPPRVDPPALVTEPYRQRDTQAFVAKTGVSTADIAYNPLYTLSQVAAAAAVGSVKNVPPFRMDPASLVTEPYRMSKSPPEYFWLALCAWTTLGES